MRDALRDPRVAGIVSITEVDVAPDLRHARVYVSVFGTEDERASTMAALNHARPFLRRELAKRTSLRYTPDLTFISDESLERAQRLTDELRRTADERGEKL